MLLNLLSMDMLLIPQLIIIIKVVELYGDSFICLVLVNLFFFMVFDGLLFLLIVIVVLFGLIRCIIKVKYFFFFLFFFFKRFHNMFFI